MIDASARSHDMERARRLRVAAEQLRLWGHAHHRQVADAAVLDEFRHLDAVVHRLAMSLGISVPCPKTKLSCEGFTHLPMYLSNITRALGGKRVVLDPRWDDRLRAIQWEAQAVIDLTNAGQAGGETTAGGEEWLTAGEAVERANKAGISISLSWLTRDAKNRGVKVRAAVLPGRHRQEVEWNSLAGCLLRRAAQPDSDDPPDGQKAEIEERKRKAREQKRMNRSCD
jgi:hypothetical protein